MRLLYRAATSVVNRNGVASPIYEQLLSSLVFLAQHDILRTDNLLAGKLILPFLGEAACHCVVQRRWPGEIIPGSS